MAELVVARALFLIGKHLVRLVNLFKFLLRLFIAGVQVGVIFFCRFAVGFFQFVIGYGFIHPEDFIIISFIVSQSNFSYKLYVEDFPFFKGEVKMQFSAYCLLLSSTSV